VVQAHTVVAEEVTDVHLTEQTLVAALAVLKT
jgi:hypothetical protein